MGQLFPLAHYHYLPSIIFNYCDRIVLLKVSVMSMMMMMILRAETCSVGAKFNLYLCCLTQQP